jgi:hypothetical protein
VIPSRYVPLYDENGRFVVDIQFNQDYMAWYTQGPIAKRELEKLGKSDEGIILFRSMLKQQVDLVQDGGEPMCVFRDPEENRGLEAPLVPQEQFHWGNAAIRRQPGPAEPGNTDRVRDEQGRPWQGQYVYVPSEAGYSADADKIVAAMHTWEGFPDDRRIALRTGRERVVTGA